MKTAKFNQFVLLLRYRASAKALVPFGLPSGENQHLAWASKRDVFKTTFGKGEILCA